MKLKKAMVVDDQEMICNLVKASLENAWPTLKVTKCSDSTRALEKIKALLPDLVLLDVQMGEVSGDDIAQAMKEDPATRAIPIVFLTGILTPEEAHARQNEIGGKHFLAKPIDFNELIATVEKYID
jgi:CheY-like chemotaxis protein